MRPPWYTLTRSATLSPWLERLERQFHLRSPLQNLHSVHPPERAAALTTTRSNWLWLLHGGSACTLLLRVLLLHLGPLG